MRRRPKWPSDLEKTVRKTFAPETIRVGAERVLAADANAGVLFETALQLGGSPADIDGWSMSGALSHRGIKASYDSSLAFLERLSAIAAGDKPATTLEMRAQAAPEPSPERSRPHGPGGPGRDRPGRPGRPGDRRRGGGPGGRDRGPRGQGGHSGSSGGSSQTTP